MSPILHTLAHRLEQLPVQERKLAESILQSPEDVLHLGIRELSERCGVSAATVTRFCKSLHFKGYPDFKMKLAAELSHSNRNGEESYQDIVAGNSLSRIVQAIQANHTASIADTTRLLDYDKLEQAIAWLSATSRIDLYGMATSSIVAQDFTRSSSVLARTALPLQIRICRLPLPPRSEQEMSPLPSLIQEKPRRPLRLYVVQRNRG